MRILPTILVLLAGFILFLNACTSPRTTSESPTISSKTPAGYTPITLTVSSVSSPPLSVYLTFSKYPRLNESVYITCRVYSKDNAPNTSARINLPNGVELVSGNLEWHGDLIKYYERYFTAQIMFNKSGNQTIEATASYAIDGKNSLNAQDTISLDFGSDGVLNSTLPDWRINRYAVIETLLEISHTPTLNEPVTLFVSITSPVDVPSVDEYGLKAVIIFPREDFELVDGSNIVPVTIKANEPIQFSVVVTFKKAGLWTISACVEELIIEGPGPMGMYHDSPKNTISFTIVE